MQIRMLKAIENTVAKINGATDIDVWWGKIIARGRRLASPYVSHRYIEYEYNPSPSSAIYVSDARSGHAIVLKAWDDSELKSFPNSPLGRMTRLVAVWESGTVPFYTIEPVAWKIEAIGLPSVRADQFTLTSVYIRVPRIRGCYDRHPMYFLADEENKVMDIANRVEEVAGGENCAVYRLGEEIPVPYRTRIGGWLVFSDEYSPEPDEERHCPFYIVEVNGVPAAVARIDGPGTVWCRRQMPHLAQVGEGEYLMALFRPII